MNDSLKRDYSVLLVDDDQFLLDMYAVKFSSCGCDVKSVVDPKAGLAYLREGHAPDVILLDIMMPGLSGFEFLEAVKNEGLAKGAAIIMLTNQGQQEDVERAMALGADGYIIKASAIPSEVLKKTIDIADKIGGEK